MVAFVEPREDELVRRGPLVVAAGIGLFVGAALVVAWSVSRENQRKITVDPTPPLGPLRTTVMATGVAERSLVVDDADVWVLREGDAGAVSLNAIAKATSVERVVASLPQAEELVGVDATHVYFVGDAPPRNVRRATKAGAIDVTVYDCRPPVVVEPSAIVGVADRGLVRLDLATAKRIASTKVAYNEVIDLASGAGFVFVTSQQVNGSMHCTGGMQAWSTSDGAMNEWDSDGVRMRVAADADGVVTAAGGCDMSGDAITLHTAPTRSAFLANGEGTTAVALTAHHVAWCSERRRDLLVVAKSGGAVTPIGGARGCHALVTDANSAYFLDDSGALVRVEGLN